MAENFPMQLDHLMWAVPDLEAGIETLARLAGCRASLGGAHPGNGTCNALLGLGLGGERKSRAGCYLEIIAPDPKQPRAGTMGAELEALDWPRLRTWAVISGDLDTVAMQLGALGVATDGPRAMSRRTVDGELLAWRILFARDEGLGGVMPFFIDWGNTPHPSSALGGISMARLVLPQALGKAPVMYLTSCPGACTPRISMCSASQPSLLPRKLARRSARHFLPRSALPP